MTAAVVARRAAIREALEGAQVADPAAECRWISAPWLAAWADGEAAPPPIDNSPLLCEHNRLDPRKVTGVPARYLATCGFVT